MRVKGTRAERAHRTAERYAHEALATRDPIAIHFARVDLDATTTRLQAQRARRDRTPHVYETSDLDAGETLTHWRNRRPA